MPSFHHSELVTDGFGNQRQLIIDTQSKGPLLLNLLAILVANNVVRTLDGLMTSFGTVGYLYSLYTGLASIALYHVP
jgi:hypothetical protein